ncbi:hypothetical protein V5O48_018121 [Marasmius crinis-equi]|uniref:Uncharacterized protein n=1 Tax=Marasmius crinis-equi TaxID=585013 RepID=A0ABR3EM75_9AGAR
MTCKADGLRVPWKTVSQVKEQVDVEAANIKNKTKSTSEIHKYALEWRRGTPLDTKRKRSSNLLDSDSYQDGEHSSSASPVATPKKKQNLGQVQLAASGSRPSNLGVTESLQPSGSRNFACVEIPSSPHREATLARLPAASLSLKRSVADEEKTPFSSASRYRTQDMNVAAGLPLMTAGPVLPKKAGSSLSQENHPSTSTLIGENRTAESTFMELEEELERELNKFKHAKESLKLLRNYLPGPLGKTVTQLPSKNNFSPCVNKDLKAKLERKTANERSLKEQLSDKNAHLSSIVNDAIRLWQVQAPQFLKPLLHLLKNTYKRVKQSASAPGDRASSEELRQAVVYLEVALKECCTSIIGEEGLERLKILGGKADEEIKHRLETYYAERPEMFGPDIEAALESVFESK